MRLKNKKTGEIVEWEHGSQYKLGKEYQSIEEFVKDWEDAPEGESKQWRPKPYEAYYYVDVDGEVRIEIAGEYLDEDDMMAIGNMFKTEKEAKKTAAKLKAWQRLKKAGFEFASGDYLLGRGTLKFSYDGYKDGVEQFENDMNLLFGGDDEEH